MAERVFRVGCGAGFGGDRLDAAVSVVAALAEAGGPACMMFETLAERTLALAQLERAAGRIGYDVHLLDRLAPVLATCLDRKIAIVGNFGVADPAGAADGDRRPSRQPRLPGTEDRDRDRRRHRLRAPGRAISRRCSRRASQPANA